MNKVMLIGNVGRDPEIKYYDQDQAIATFSLATTKAKSHRKAFCHAVALMILISKLLVHSTLRFTRLLILSPSTNLRRNFVYSCILFPRDYCAST